MKFLNSTKRYTLFSYILLIAITFSSCKKDDSSPIFFDLTKGVTISNEGSFGAGNASLSIFIPEKNKVINDIYTKTNNLPLGDVFQSIGFSNQEAYLIINASNKINIVDKDSCYLITTIENISSPRYFSQIDNQKAYITIWGDGGKVDVLDLESKTITKQIAVGSGPEKMAIASGKAFVTNSGGWSTDNKVSVINTTTDEVTATITVGDNPKDIIVDKNNKVWVLCTGNIVYDGNYNILSQTESQLVRINPSTNEIETTISLGETYHPSLLEVNATGDVLYYGGDWSTSGIFSISITASAKATTPLINDNLYGFNVDPTDGVIYGLQSPSFTSSGTLKTYSSSGELLGSYSVGIGPNGAYFAD